MRREQGLHRLGRDQPADEDGAQSLVVPELEVVGAV